MAIVPLDDNIDCSALISASLRALARRGRLRRFKKGQTLIEEGDVDDTVFIMLSGSVRVFSVSEDKEREFLWGEYRAGDYLGELGLDGQPRTATVTALEACCCSTVNRSDIRQHIAEDPEFAFELLSKVIWRARNATYSAKQLALNDVYGRFVAMVERLAVPAEDGMRAINEKLSHRELAARLGCGRTMVSKLMKQVREVGGYVRSEPKRMLILRKLPPRF